MEDKKGSDEVRIMNDQAETSPVAARKPTRGRRGFLAGAGAAGIAGAAVVAAGVQRSPAVAGAADEAAAPKPVTGRGYHETDHVRKYYDTTKV